MIRCGSHTSESDIENLNLLRDQRKLSHLTADVILNIPVQYIIVTDGSFTVTLNQLQKQHQVINQIYKGENNDDLDQLPNNSKYPYQPIKGNPNISFTPQILTIEQIKIITNTSLNYSSVNDIENNIPNGTKLAKGLNIYVTKLENQILGIAKSIPSQACAVDYRTIGNKEVPGIFGNTYGQGKTLAHEIGHCFGLVHPFSSAKCTSRLSLFLDKE